MAISKKAQAIIDKINSSPESAQSIMQQIDNQLSGAVKVTPQQVQKSAGLFGPQPKAIFEDIAKTAIDRSDPAKIFEQQQKELEAKNIASETARTEGKFGALKDLGSIIQPQTDQPPIAVKEFDTTRFEEVPTGVSPTGEVETGIEETHEEILKKQREAQQITAMNESIKDSFKSKGDLVNVDLKVGNTFDSWLDTVNDTFQEFGIRPGPASGLVTSVTGRTKQNPFFEGFKGGLVEYSAAVGRIAIPGSRAVRIIDIFKKTAPSEFSSISSGINNASRTYQNAISSDIAAVKEAGGRDYDKLIREHGSTRAYLDSVVQTFREGLAVRVLQRNPDLMTDEDQVKLLGGVLREDDETGQVFLVDPANNSIISEVSEEPRKSIPGGRQ